MNHEQIRFINEVIDEKVDLDDGRMVGWMNEQMNENMNEWTYDCTNEHTCKGAMETNKRDQGVNLWIKK